MPPFHLRAAKLLLLAVLACALVGLATRASLAQAVESPATETKPAAGKVQEVKPQVYYLKDKEGNLLPVPDMTLEDFKRLYDLSQGLNTEPPAYSLRNAKITGSVRDGKAELDVELTIVITAKSGSWTRVPLRFNSSVLREPPKHDGQGEIFLDFDPDAEGYVCWLKADNQSQHTLRCKFVSQVQELGAESRLPLVVPRATSGSLTLSVPEASAKARAIRRVEDIALDVTSQGGGSRIEMLGPSGEFQIAWRAGGGISQGARQTLEATGAAVVKLEGKRRVTAETRLRMRSFGAPLESFVVRLPPGMRWVPLDQPGVQFSVLESEVDETSQKQIQIVEVRLANKTNGPIDVPLFAEYLRETGSTDQPIEVGGFEVVDAVKQRGTIELFVEGDQSAVWFEGANVHRIDDVSTTDPRSVKPIARFEYDAQPYSLQVQVVPRKTRLTVEPLYIVYVENQQLRLDATLKYKVRGAKTFSLEHNFDGWTIDRVGPDTLVQSESLLPERISPLTIPLIAAAVPTSGEFEIKVQAHRDLPLDLRELRFDLPRPAGSNLTPGSLVVVPANNIDLTTRLADLQGLAPDPLPMNLALPPRQQTPQFYRELGGGTVARFSAGMDVRKRLVSVASSGDVRLDAARATVLQRLTYNIAYEPLRSVEIEVAKALWEAGQIQAQLDGAALPVTLVPPDSEKPLADESRVLVRVDLLEDRIGRLELEVQYASTLPQLGEAETEVDLPLALPYIDGAPAKSSQVLNVTHDERISLEASDEAWTISQPLQPPATQEPVTLWRHASGAASVPMTLALRAASSAGLIAVDQAWVQSWIAGDRRQDRAVFRVASAADRLRLQMPPQVRDADLVVAINGRRVGRRLLDPEGILTLELPNSQQATSSVIELWYEVPLEMTPAGVLQLEPPAINGAGEARRAYWQIVMPGSQHLLSGPTNLAADMQWQWVGTHFGRVGRLSQAELERFSGASLQTDLPQSANAFLFSSFGSLPKIEIRVASRRTVLLMCSGLVLVAGLALLYLPALRHPLMIMLLGVGVAALTLWNPDGAILVAQAAVAGLGCALLAQLLKSLYGRRSVQGVSLRSPSPSAIEGRSTEPHVRYEPGSQATTATAPLVAAAAPGESPP